MLPLLAMRYPWTHLVRWKQLPSYLANLLKLKMQQLTINISFLSCIKSNEILQMDRRKFDQRRPWMNISINSVESKEKKSVALFIWKARERPTGFFASWLMRAIARRPTSVWLKLRIGNGRQFGKLVKKRKPSDQLHELKDALKLLFTESIWWKIHQSHFAPVADWRMTDWLKE